ncbi:MAG: tRNA (adenosine(37)-N6)-threonylcarbamoyltransferase complex ATPase subunit type 1 TsaE [Candidatus Omnitrophica bacterium]|nr:tRNA (adenosine(37)-N6)-threonylcarbamoyltransferase complex ATPase subunit type 1 TsaE [Candidatus Omnitrophota bacterium]
MSTKYESRNTKYVFETVTKSIEETQQFGERLGALLQAGDVVALIGELGSGKTTCIQGIAKGLGINPGVVKSPTFVLLRDYSGGRVGMIHVDGYRLEGEGQAVWLDVEWMFSTRKVTVIEWADRVAGCLPEDYVELRFTHKTTNQRVITAIPHGPCAAELVARLRTEGTQNKF